MESSGLDDIYPDVILEHRRNPRNRDKLDEAHITASDVNPFCGDEVYLQIALDEQDRVERIGLQAVGCSINQAAASMLTEAIQGKPLEKVEALSSTFSQMMQGDTPAEEAVKNLGNLQVLAGVRRYPVRIKCALLAWSALDDGILEYRSRGRK